MSCWCSLHQMVPPNSWRPTLTQARKGKGNVSRTMALVRPGPSGTAETLAALRIN